MGVRGLFEGWHLIVLILVIVVVFGASRLPDAARSLGRSMRIFKSEVNQMHDDGRTTSAASKDTVDGDVVKETTTTTRTTETSAGASKDEDFVVIDGVRYRREAGGDTPPRA